MSDDFNLEQAKADLLTLWNSHPSTQKANFVEIKKYGFVWRLAIWDDEPIGNNISRLVTNLFPMKIDPSDEDLYHEAMIMLKQNFAEFDAERRKIEMNDES